MKIVTFCHIFFTIFEFVTLSCDFLSVTFCPVTFCPTFQNSYGTKWFLVMVRNCNFVVRNGKLWYEMAMVRNGYGTK
jgi:hypothetical protein